MAGALLAAVVRFPIIGFGELSADGASASPIPAPNRQQADLVARDGWVT
jgi:hypothetical protein